jgi:transposase
LFTGSENESCDSLGMLFGNSPRSVSNWIKRVNQTGDIESLRSKLSSGRPSRLTKAQKEEIKTVIQELPEKRGMRGRKWNGINLSLYILANTMVLR